MTGWLAVCVSVWLADWLAGWLTRLYLENGWLSSSTALSRVIQRQLLIFVVLFTGFPRISWNVGAESKYLQVVKNRSRKIDHPSTTKRGLSLCSWGRKNRSRHGIFWFERGACCWTYRWEVWDLLQVSERARTPLWWTEAPLCTCCPLECCGDVRRQRALWQGAQVWIVVVKGPSGRCRLLWLMQLPTTPSSALLQGGSCTAAGRQSYFSWW